MNGEWGKVNWAGGSADHHPLIRHACGVPPTPNREGVNKVVIGVISDEQCYKLQVTSYQLSAMSHQPSRSGPDVIEHVLCEAAGEGVLLAGVIGRQQPRQPIAQFD